MTRTLRGGSFSAVTRLAALALALPLLAFATAAPAAAQDSQVQGLANKVDRLQRELLDLQRTVYQGAPAPAVSGGAAGGDVNTTQAARIELRLQQFERAQQTLTGQVEELGFAVEEMKRRLDLLVADVDRRLQALESGNGGGGALVLEGTTPDGTMAGDTTGGAAAGVAPGTADGALGASGAGGTAGTLGTVSESSLANVQGTQQPTSSGEVVLTGSDKDQYDQAFALLRQGNYADAEAALRSFVAGNPSSPLVGNAKYWLGETYYARGDYQQAAVTFAEAYQEYPDGSKAPDNLLKLGMSLASLNSIDDACGTFAELLNRYPNAASSIQRRVQIERQKYSCP